MSELTSLKNPDHRSSVEVPDILKQHIEDYKQRFPLSREQHRVVRALIHCRTAHLGGHVERCEQCGIERIAYNSCRNRHCPKCQNIPREKWLMARKSEVLPVVYFHAVFTTPHELNPLILHNKSLLFNVLFTSVSETLLEFGRNPKNSLGGRLGFIAILHTWDQMLNAHYHLHCLIPGGVLTEDWSGWKSCRNDYLFDVHSLSIVFRGKFIHALSQAYKQGKLYLPGITEPLKDPDTFDTLKQSLYKKNWVVYIKKPIRKPEYVIDYLGRYTHRVAISNHRIISLEKGMVCFSYKDRKNNLIRQTSLPAVEFIRRFLLHVLPKGFVKIRQYGYLSNRNRRENLLKIRKIFSLPESTAASEPLAVIMLKLTGIDISLCPVCRKGRMAVVGMLSPHKRENSSPTKWNTG